MQLLVLAILSIRVLTGMTEDPPDIHIFLETFFIEGPTKCAPYPPKD